MQFVSDTHFGHAGVYRFKRAGYVGTNSTSGIKLASFINCSIIKMD